MLKNAKQILKDADYYVTYTYNGDYEAVLTASFKKGYSRKIKYKGGVLSGDGFRMKMPRYAILPFVEVWINKNCEELGYGTEMLHHTIRGSPVSYVRFGELTDPQEIEQASWFYDLYKDIWHFGVKPQHVDIAKEADVYLGFQKLVKAYLGVGIGT